MKNEIVHLLEKLSSKDDNVRNNSFLNISLLVESALIPALARENNELLDIHCLQKLQLMKSDAKAVLVELFECLSNDTIPLEIRVGIVCLLGKFDNIEFLEASMKLLQQSYSVLDNQQIYSILASINPPYLPREEWGAIAKMIQEINLTDALVELRKRDDNNVNDALFHMWGKFSQIDFKPEDFSREYTWLSLWYIKNNYKFLGCEELNSLLQSMPYEDVARNNPSLLKTMVEQYNFKSILNEIDVRLFEEFHVHLVNECPEELAGVLECYDKDEYDKDHEVLKETIVEVKKYL